jgi:Leucine-rich repeat (LRR) protein
MSQNPHDRTVIQPYLGFDCAQLSPTELNLCDDSIVDLKPFAGLNNLTNLYLNSNKIIDVKPLAELRNLTRLYLDRNQIVDIKPLTELRKLTQLYLNRNQIAVKTCPLKPDSICRF